MQTPIWTYGDLIRKARTLADLDQRELAGAVGVTQATVSKWERDKSRPDVDEFLRIVTVTRADWLIDQALDLATTSSTCELSALLAA